MKIKIVFFVSCLFFFQIVSGQSINQSIQGIINEYAAVLSYDPCQNSLGVSDASKFNPGDTIFLIQMKGAIVDTTNTSSFGTILSYNNSGNNEFNIIRSKSGNTLILEYFLKSTYDIPNGKVQIIRVPYYQTATIQNTITCLPWNGNIGGVVVLNARDSIILNSSVDVSAKGFRGAILEVRPSDCNNTSYVLPNSSTGAALKGEGIVALSDNLTRGRGAAANGGGSGNDHNSGGAGGGNGGNGGNGGREFGCNTTQLMNGGLGGKQLIQSATRIYLGGGGGAGDANNGNSTPAGNGGGIIVINTNKLVTNRRELLAKGATAANCTPDCWDAQSGGGAGGSVVLNVNIFSDSLYVNTIGGDGASLQNNNTALGFNGPGGGGGGGVMAVKLLGSPYIKHNTNGGKKGLFLNTNTSEGATDGTIGVSTNNFILHTADAIFQANIDSIAIQDSIYGCSSTNLVGFAALNSGNVSSWYWDFGDGSFASGQNQIHNYSSPGTFTIKLKITDNYGCQDSVSKDIIISDFLNVTTAGDTTLCDRSTVQLNAFGGTTYSWFPTQGLSNPNIPNPLATVDSSIKYFVTITNGPNCSASDSVVLVLNERAIVNLPLDTSVCSGKPFQLNPSVNNATLFTWSPSSGISDTTILDPVFNLTASATYILQANNISGCLGTDTISITVNPTPIISLPADQNICRGDSFQIHATVTGASIYSWSPANGLNSYSILNPFASPVINTTYILTGVNNGCSGSDSIDIIVNDRAMVDLPEDTTVCSGIEFQLHPISNNATNYLWNSGIGLSDSTISDPLFNLNSNSNFILIANNVSNCPASDTITILVTPTPIVNILQDEQICIGGSAQLNSTINGATQYTWSPGNGLSSTTILNPIANPTVSTNYYLTGLFNGCSATDSATVTVLPTPVFAVNPNQQSVCLNESAEFIASGGDTYRWIDQTGTTIATSPRLLISSFIPQDYIVIIHDQSCNYLDTLAVSLDISPNPVISISKSNDIDCINTTSTLMASGGISFIWSPNQYINSNNSPNPTVSPQQDMWYKVIVGNSDNCFAEDSILVKVDPSAKDGKFYVANAFTPNNDGKNDCFGVKYWGVVEKFELSIYNRWGQVVFKTTDITQCWDGKFKGVLQATDVFAYQIKAKSNCSDTPIYKKGLVSLIR